MRFYNNIVFVECKLIFFNAKLTQIKIEKIT